MDPNFGMFAVLAHKGMHFRYHDNEISTAASQLAYMY